MKPATLEAACYDRSLLSDEEIEYLESLETMVVEDRTAIKNLAETLSSASYKGVNWLPVSRVNDTLVVCYRNAERIRTLLIDSDYITTGNAHVWKHAYISTVIASLTPELDPFRWRLECKRNLRALAYKFKYYLKNEKTYPPPGKWCDALLPARKGAAYRSVLAELTCPSAGEGRCHYAMNPDCTPDAPSDVVLLFETKAGWNQHGGPELFTLDNHDPRGGFVMLNDADFDRARDATVLFIRTRQRFEQLR